MSNFASQELYTWLKDLIKSTGKSPTTLASEAGVSSNVLTRYINEYESGVKKKGDKYRGMSTNTIRKIAKTFDVVPDFIEAEKIEEEDTEAYTKSNIIRKFVKECVKSVDKPQYELEADMNLKPKMITWVVTGRGGAKKKRKVLNALSEYTGVAIPEELKDLSDTSNKIRIDGSINLEMGDMIHVYDEMKVQMVTCPLDEYTQTNRMKAVKVKGSRTSLCVGNYTILYYREPANVKIPKEVFGKDCVVKKKDGCMLLKYVETGNKIGEYTMFSSYDRSRPVVTMDEDEIEWVSKVRYIRPGE